MEKNGWLVVSFSMTYDLYYLVFQTFISSSVPEKVPRPVDPCGLSDCQVCNQLPYNINTGQLVVHHLFTGRGLWNEGERLKNLNLAPGSSIMYPGGNTNGADGYRLMKQCPKW